MKKLKIIANALKSNQLKDKRILLEGHTDSVGTNEYNMELSQRRAQAVVNQLTKQFKIRPKRLTALGFGEIYPVASNLTEKGKSKNRRVSLFIYNQ